jgi:hypothetical protein
MRVISGAVLATAIIFHLVPGASAQTASANSATGGWELATIHGTVSALMPPVAEKSSRLVRDEINGGMRFVSEIVAREAGAEYSVREIGPLPEQLLAMSPTAMQAIFVAEVAHLLGYPGRDVVVPAGLATPAIEGWGDGSHQIIRFYRIFLHGDDMVIVSANSVSHPGAETAIRRFADSVKLEHRTAPASPPKGAIDSIDLTPLRLPPTDPVGTPDAYSVLRKLLNN